MNEQHADMMQQITGQICTLFYFVDESTTTLTIQADGQIITVRTTGQVALDLRTLSRGALRETVPGTTAWCAARCLHLHTHYHRKQR